MEITLPTSRLWTPRGNAVGISQSIESIDRVSVLGPDKHIAKEYNNKLVQHNVLKDVVPLIEGRSCEGFECLLETTASLRQEWSEGIFISTAYSAGGANSAITYSQDEVIERFQEQQKQLREYTVAVGRVLGKAGYRGIFGCDYLIDHEGQIFFLEINARKQGTTLEFCFTLEQTLPEGAPMLPELEYYAVTENRFPPQTVEMNGNHRGIHWGTYNYKITSKQLTTGYIPQNPYERETFKKIARKELIKDFVILEHLGTNFLVSPGTFLARVVSVARCKEDVAEGLCQGIGFIKQTIQEA